MNKINYIRVLFLIAFSANSLDSVIYAQNSIDFSFNRTGPNHSVLALPIWHPVIKQMQEQGSIPEGVFLGFQSDSLESGDLVGVFYTDKAGNYKCASSVSWKSNDFNMLPVWGNFPPEADNGMEMGERMIWLAQKKDNLIYEIECSYQKPLMAIYIKDGASAVLGMRLSKSETLTPLLPLKK
jgi:hypothetical protein